MADDKPCDILHASNCFGNAVKDLTGSALEQVAQGVTEAFGKAVAWLGTFWVNVDTPPLISSGTKSSAEVEFLQGHLWFWTLSLAVMAILVGAGRMMWEQRGEPLRQIALGLVRFILVSAGGVAAIQLLITASDALAKWLIDEATAGAGFGTNLAAMINLSGNVGVILVIVLGLIAVIISLIQLVLMVFRSGLLVVLAGIFPTTAAFTNTEMGRQWFQRCVGWIIAFVLYKPAAALIYATAFKLTGANFFGKDDDGSGGVKILAGLGLMFIALIALPALMRFVTPMVSAVAGGGGGGAALGAMAGSLATGAINKGSFSGGSRSGGHQSSSHSPGTAGEKGPQGANGTGSKSNPSGGRSTPATGASTPGTSAASAPAAGTGAAAAGTAAGGGAGAGAAAAAGPVGAGIAVATQVAKKGTDAAKGAAESSTGEGPSGSKG
jgi:hypothetical protein